MKYVFEWDRIDNCIGCPMCVTFIELDKYGCSLKIKSIDNPENKKPEWCPISEYEISIL